MRIVLALSSTPILLFGPVAVVVVGALPPVFGVVPVGVLPVPAGPRPDEPLSGGPVPASAGAAPSTGALPSAGAKASTVPSPSVSTGTPPPWPPTTPPVWASVSLTSVLRPQAVVTSAEHSSATARPRDRCRF